MCCEQRLKDLANERSLQAVQISEGTTLWSAAEKAALQAR